jgi:hypothetical protein
MKITIVHISLLTLWILAISAPSLISIYEEGDTAIFVMNLGEEEQEEQGGKDIGEEKIIPSFPYKILQVFPDENNSSLDNYILGRSNFSLDISLPPPEQIV